MLSTILQAHQQSDQQRKQPKPEQQQSQAEPASALPRDEQNENMQLTEEANDHTFDSQAEDNFWCVQVIPVHFQGTIKGPSHEHFNPSEAAKNLRKAFKGLGTDEKVIIEVLGSHVNWQRQEIKLKYKQLYNRDIISDLEDELGGHFLEGCLSLMTPSAIYDAHCLRKAMKGNNTNEISLIELLCSRTATEINLIREAYLREYDRDLENDIAAETSPSFGKLIHCVMNGHKEIPVEDVDLKQCEKDAARLIQIGIKSTEATMLNEILANRCSNHLRKVFEIYKKKAGKDIEQEIRKQFSGDIKEAYVAMIKLAKSPSTFFAQKIHDSLKGAMTDDETLIRVIISRSEKDLQQIKEEYLRKYKTTLAKSVKDDCSGDYSRLLLKIIGNA